jgi:hypothetical protein
VPIESVVAKPKDIVSGNPDQQGRRPIKDAAPSPSGPCPLIWLDLWTAVVFSRDRV